MTSGGSRACTPCRGEEGETTHRTVTMRSIHTRDPLACSISSIHAPTRRSERRHGYHKLCPSTLQSPGPCKRPRSRARDCVVHLREPQSSEASHHCAESTMCPCRYPNVPFFSCPSADMRAGRGDRYTCIFKAARDRVREMALGPKRLRFADSGLAPRLPRVEGLTLARCEMVAIFEPHSALML